MHRRNNRRDREKEVEWLKNTGDDEMEVFIRGDNGSIIPVDDVILMKIVLTSQGVHTPSIA